MKTYGTRTILILTSVPLLFGGLILYIANRPLKEQFATFTTLLVTLLIYGIFLFTIIRIDVKLLRVSYVLNPFKRKIKIPIDDIEKIEFTVNTRRGSSTTINIYTKTDKTEIHSAITRFERKKLQQALNKLGIKTETFMF